MSEFSNYFKHMMDSLYAFVTNKKLEEHDLSKSEDEKRLIESTIAEKDREIFKHFCHEDLRKLLKLNSGKTLRDQTVEDILDHMDRALTKGNITDHEKTFCAEVLAKMLESSENPKILFDRIEAHIGNEHFVHDLISHSTKLKTIVDGL